MTTATTKFDIDALARSIEARDADGVARHYADDAEISIVDRDNPPSSPRKVRGKDEIGRFFEDECARDVNHRVTHTVVDGNTAGYHVSCQYPTGERVACAALIELRDGKIQRLDGVQAWDG
jgi:ketosteroid isomerase-like protein